MNVSGSVTSGPVYFSGMHARMPNTKTERPEQAPQHNYLKTMFIFPTVAWMAGTRMGSRAGVHREAREAPGRCAEPHPLPQKFDMWA